MILDVRDVAQAFPISLLMRLTGLDVDEATKIRIQFLRFIEEQGDYDHDWRDGSEAWRAFRAVEDENPHQQPEQRPGSRISISRPAAGVALDVLSRHKKKRAAGSGRIRPRQLKAPMYAFKRTEATE